MYLVRSLKHYVVKLPIFDLRLSVPRHYPRVDSYYIHSLPPLYRVSRGEVCPENLFSLSVILLRISSDLSDPCLPPDTRMRIKKAYTIPNTNVTVCHVILRKSPYDPNRVRLTSLHRMENPILVQL